MSSVHLARELFIAVCAFLALFIFVPIFTYFYFAKDLQSKDSIMNRNNTGLVLLDDQGQPFFTFYQAKYAEFVPIDQIPQILAQAVVASEDKDFYIHPGFSIRGILRSIVANIKTGEFSQGGSTITQQLVKNSLLSPQKSFLRKYQEIVLAQELERRYPKHKILEMYVNSAYWGKGAFGVQQAARKYFGKDVNQLNLAEVSFLAGILPAPSRFSDFTNNYDQARTRQEHVLSNMLELGMITQDQKTQAVNTPLKFSNSQDALNTLAPHFAIMVKDALVNQYGEEQVARSGFIVQTTLNRSWQEYAQRSVQQHVKALAKDRVSNGAAVVLDPQTGEIKALVGSVDWFNDQFGKVNIITSPRQPGSSFKLVVYSAAFEKHTITSATVLHDEPTVYPNKPVPYAPRDFDGQFRGPVLVRRAFANSLNVPAVEVLARVGVSSAVEMAQRLGITTVSDQSKYGLALALGAAEVKPIDLASAYGVFANGGYRVPPVSILQITDKRKQVIYSYNPQPQQILEPEYAFLISSILSDNSARQEVFGNELTISRPAAVKTGTTQSFRDAWTIGYTPGIVIAVWVGNNDNRMMNRVAGALGAAPIWKDLMEHFLAGTAVEQFIPPGDIVSLTLCPDGSVLREPNPSAKQEYFVAGTEPKRTCIIPSPTSQAAPSNQPSPSETTNPAPTSTP